MTYVNSVSVSPKTLTVKLGRLGRFGTHMAENVNYRLYIKYNNSFIEMAEINETIKALEN